MGHGTLRKLTIATLCLQNNTDGLHFCPASHRGTFTCAKQDASQGTAEGAVQRASQCVSKGVQSMYIKGCCSKSEA